MNKVFGLTERYKPINTAGRETIVSYGRETFDERNSTWYEIPFSQKNGKIPSLEDIKLAITADINDATRIQIISSLTWNDKSIWLSSENQMDWKSAYDLAILTNGQNLPITFKLGEDSEGNAVYHTFTSVEEFGNFWKTCIEHILNCLTEGWTLKDSINWEEYITLS